MKIMHSCSNLIDSEVIFTKRINSLFVCIFLCIHVHTSGLFGSRCCHSSATDNEEDAATECADI